MPLKNMIKIDLIIKINFGLLSHHLFILFSRVNEAPKEKKYVSDGSFTKHLMTTGMYKYSGLNCSFDKERVINGSKDWQLNL